MKKYGFGVDIGGTTCKIGLFETTGALIEKWEIQTRRENNGENILPDVAASIAKKMVDREISKTDIQGRGCNAVCEPGMGRNQCSKGYDRAYGISCKSRQ